MSAPVQALPFHAISVRGGPNGLPLRSHDARLYRMRRFAGQAHAQPSVWPMPVGSELSRRPIWLPACVHAPQKIQHPLDVVPSSFSCAKPDSWSPFFRSTFVGSFGSVTSASALPLYSIAISSGVGLSGLAYGHVRFTIGSGYLPPCSLYALRMRRNSPDMISRSLLASPGPCAPCQCHWSTRLELTSEPRSSAKHVVGRRNTSVWIFDASTSLNSPKFLQNSDVSVASGSMMTSHFSFARLAPIFDLFGAAASGLNPCAM